MNGGKKKLRIKKISTEKKYLHNQTTSNQWDNNNKHIDLLIDDKKCEKSKCGQTECSFSFFSVFVFFFCKWKISKIVKSKLASMDFESNLNSIGSLNSSTGKFHWKNEKNIKWHLKKKKKGEETKKNANYQLNWFGILNYPSGWSIDFFQINGKNRKKKIIQFKKKKYE